MKLDSVGQVLGSRDLTMSDGHKVVVLIGVPTKVPDGGDDYVCPYQIVGIGDGGVRYAMGIDSFQALQLTLKKIGTDLYTSEEAKAGGLSWEGGSVQGDLGFPVPDVLKDLLPPGIKGA